MKVLLDENVPVQLRSRLFLHDVASINDETLGWKGIRNGVLLNRMEGRFDVLVTADQNIYAQQNLSGRSFSILVLPTNRRKTLLAMSDLVLGTLSRMKVGDYVTLKIPDM